MARAPALQAGCQGFESLMLQNGEVVELVYGSGLENRRWRKSSKGSNPFFSENKNIAIIAFIIDGYLAQRQRRRTQDA